MIEPVRIGNATLYTADCMELLKATPDKFYDLAIVDPPYGIGEANKNRKNTISIKWKNPPNRKHELKNWDNFSPKNEYFKHLVRVSKNQIIWGANYFQDNLNIPSMGWIFWDKKNGDSDFSDGELAYTSFNRGLRKFEWLWKGYQQQQIETRIHPTQKPIALYEWLLTNYAKQGDKILDTHLGSMSSVIACLNLGYEITGAELDVDYFEAGIKRVQQSQNQQRMFAPVQTKPQQVMLDV